MSLQASFSIKKVLQITKRAQGSPAAQCRAGVESPRASVLLPQQTPSQSCLNISAWRFGLISPTPTGVTNHLSTCRRGKRGSGTVQDSRVSLTSEVGTAGRAVTEHPFSSHPPQACPQGCPGPPAFPATGRLISQGHSKQAHFPNPQALQCDRIGVGNWSFANCSTKH